jgi:hypothetical protein
MSTMPEGDKLRNAVKWISEEREKDSEAKLGKLINEACTKFDLPPKDSEFLMNFFSKKQEE